MTWAGTPPETPHRWDGVTSRISDKAYSRAALVSSELGVTSCLSRAIWSSGVVVVSPQPGQANPGQTTHDDGAVWVRPARALNERILAGPPTAYHRLVAASLSLSSIICSASVRSLADSPLPSPGPRSDSSVSRTSSLTMLASACGWPWPRCQRAAGAEIVDGGQDGTGPARQVRGRGRAERIPAACPGRGRRPRGRRRRGTRLRGTRPRGRRRRGHVEPGIGGRLARGADRAGRAAEGTGRASRTRRGQPRHGADGDGGAGPQRHEHDPDARPARPGPGAP